MKKKFTLFIMMLAALLSSSSAWAQTFIQGDMKYTVLDADAKTVSVAKANNDITGNITIPSNVVNENVSYTVTEVATDGFYSTTISGITIPATVMSVNQRAFQGCHSLSNFTIEDSEKELSVVSGYDGILRGVNTDKTIYVGRDLVVTTGENPFYANVVSVTFGDKVTSIAKRLFYDQNKLYNVVIGNGVKTIGSEAFRGAGDDENVGELSVTMGENVESIGASAFDGCSKLYGISLPSNLKLIEGYAFSSSGLQSISIPASVDSIGKRAFGYCGNLSSIRFEDSDKPLKLINGYDGTFNYSQADKSVYVGRDLTFQATGSLISVGSANITSVEFGDKVTNINPQLFYDANKLYSLTIGKGVKTIGSEAFRSAGDDENVGELSVTMGENVETIGSYAFDVCSKLYGISLPSTLKLIEGYAFSGSGLGSITIPASVDSLGCRAFGYCGNLTSIRIEDSTEPLKLWRGYDGTFNYSNADKSMYIGRDLKLDADGQLFNSVTGNVTALEFGDLVTNINPYLFKESNKLYSLVIGKGVKTVGAQAFAGSGDDENVGELSVTMGENVETIGSYAFDVCPKLYSITLPSTLKLIEGYAFSGSGLGGIVIPASVDSLGKRAFGSCDNLTSIRIEDSTEPLKLWRGYDGTFNYSNADKSMYIGRDLKLDADDRLFYSGIGNVTALEFGDLVTNINPYLFKESNKLYSLVIGNGVKTIGAQAFYGSGDDENVGELSVTMGENVETIGNSAFDYCIKLNSINLPATLKTIGEWAFSMCSSLGSISIPGSVTSIGKGGFGNTPLSSITFEDGDEPCSIVLGNDATFRKPQADYSLYLGRNLVYEGNSSPFPNVTSVTIGPKTTSLPQYLFYNCDKLIWVDGGENVATMGVRPFWDCSNLQSISPLGKDLKVLPESAFEACPKLDGIVLPEGLEEIQQWAFHSCSSLTELTIPGTVKVMGTKPDGGNGYRVFYQNTAMKKLVFADSDTPLTYIETNNNGGYCRGMTNLETLYIGRDIVKAEGSVNQTIFASVANIEFGPSVTTIGTDFSQVTASTVKAPWLAPIAITNDAFNAITYSNATLWLPGGTKQAYAEAEGWKNFVNVEFASYVVSLEATKGGSLTTGDITVAGEQKAQTLIDRGNDVTFTVKPEQNYDFTSLTVNGEAVEMEENAYTYYGLYQDIDVKAIFTEKPKFDIQATVAGGTISLNGGDFLAEQTIKVYRDTDVTLSVAPAEGYQQKPAKVTVNGVDVTAQLQDNTLKIENIQEAKAIVVTFAKLQFAITAEQTQNGSIELSKQTVEWGDSFTATFKPATGYELATATVNGKDVTAEVKDNVLTVADVKEAKSVGATFKKLTFQIAAEQTQNGSIELSASTVEWGDSFTATFKPATGYELLTATVNGEDVTADVENNVLTVSDVRVNVTVGATFQKQTYAVTISGSGITVSNQNPKYGDDVTVTIDDDPDRTLVSLLVNGTDVTAQVKDGQYIIKNVTGNVTIEATFKSTKEFITMTGEYATFSCPQDLNFTGSDLRAYIASGFNKATNQALLTRVYDVPAGTGIFLVGEPGTTYKIPYSETSSYYVNLLKANLQKSTIQATEGNFTNYTFGEQAGEPGFYPIDGTATLLAQTAYMQLPTGFVVAGVKVSVVFEEDIIDGIEEFRISEQDATIYDLAGRRLGKTQRGINIVGGKKVLIK